MKIVLATPLYPPDIAEPAPYVKELARRLAPDHQVTVLAYGRLPEKVPGVTIVAADKRHPLLVRLFLYTIALWRAARSADLIYAQNGPSIELPVAVVNFFLRRPLMARWGDEAAHAYAQKKFMRRTMERLAFGGAKTVMDSPLPRPEILPLEPRPTAALAAWEESWQAHVRELTQQFHDA